MESVKVADSTSPSDSLPKVSLKDSSQRWWLLALLFTGMIFAYAQRNTLSVANTSIAKDLNLTKADMGMLQSAFFWVYAFMQMPAGWIVDRFGVRRSYSLGFIIWSVAAAACGLAKNLWILVLLRVSVGTGQAIAFPGTARAVANWFQDQERGMVTGIYLTGVRLGAALINFFGGLFLARYDWRLFFIVVGLSPLLWLLPWNRFLSKWETTKPSLTSATQPAATNPSFLKSLALLKNRTVFGIFLGFFAYDYAWFVFLSWLPGYLESERGFTKTEMAIYSSTPFLAMSVVIMLSGMISDWLVRRGYNETLVRKSFICVGLAIGCLIVPAGMVADKMTSVALLTISLCGLGMASPNTWTLTQATCEKKIVGTVSGIQNFGGNIGGIAPWLTGYIAHKTNSFVAPFGIVAGVLVIGILSYIFLIDEKVESK
jgi:ACS family D-galactonate transporter-like MFS transporter